MKRKLCIALAVLIGVMGLAGCGSETDGQPAATEVVWYIGGDEPDDFDLVMEEVNKTLLEKTGATLDLQMVDFGSYSDRMNMIISSGEEFDLCFTSNWSNDFLMNASAGAYMPIDSYLDGENSGLKAAIPNFVWADAMVNGEIYAVPNYQIMFYQSCLFTPKRLVDKYNLDLSAVTRLEDLEPYLAQLKENEPDFYPFNPKDYANIHLKLAGYYEIPGVNSLVTKSGDESFTVYSKFELPEYREILQTMSDYYQKGYIRPDILSASVEETSELIYAVYAAATKPGLAAENMIKYGEEIAEMPIGTPYIEPGFAQNTMTAVNAKSPNPQKALDIVELMNTDKELYNLLAFGIEGTHYTKTSENSIALTEGSKYPPMAAWTFGNQFNAYYMDGQEEGLWEETDRLNRESEKSLLRGFSVDVEPIKNELAKVSAVVSEYEYIEFGTEPDLTTYETFIERLKTAGLDTVKAEIERQLEDFKNGDFLEIANQYD